MNEAERKKEIERRKRESSVWAVVHVLGSLKLALTLLATIAVACAVATVYESKFNSQVAQAYIYKAPWFLIWLGVLCVNLAAAALTRWPWQKKHTGFVVTHSGIIILLIGAMVGMQFGFEASVTLRKEAAPATRLVLNETILQVDSPREGAMYLLPLPVETRTPTPENPRKLSLPNSASRLVVDRYSEAVREIERYEPEAGGGTGVALEFTSGMMGQSMPVRMYLEPGESEVRHDFFGLAEIVLSRGGGEPRRSEVPPENEETHVVFADKQPVVHVHRGEASGLEFRLVEETGGDSAGTDGWLLLARGKDGPVSGFKLSETMGREVSVNGRSVQVLEFWPDFVMRDGMPATASGELRNPAVMLTVRGEESTAKPRMVLNPIGDEGMEIALQREGTTYETREGVREGDTLATGWADWQVAVREYVPEAARRIALEPLGEESNAEGIPGIRARLVSADGVEGEPVWIRSGRSEELFTDDEVVRIGFGLRTRPVPFSIDLLNFEVPRDEGTDQPSDFISRIAFTDLETGETVERTSRMNHPASYPGDWWNVATGINYKFSQASWDPENLNETTLQVLYDPGWLFKWVGSLMICTGIAIMFYFKPYARKRRPADDALPGDVALREGEETGRELLNR